MFIGWLEGIYGVCRKGLKEYKMFIARLEYEYVIFVVEF